MSIDFRENIDPVFAKIFAKWSRKVSRKLLENRENCFRKIAKIFAKFLRKSSFAIFVGNPNWREVKVFLHTNINKRRLQQHSPKDITRAEFCACPILL